MSESSEPEGARQDICQDQGFLKDLVARDVTVNGDTEQKIIHGNQNVEVRSTVLGSAIISGNGNRVIIYPPSSQHQTQASQPESAELGPNPYRGLTAFQVEDASVYFGREAQVERLWKRLRDFHEPVTSSDLPIRFVTILGPSGCGKSSLARAGLLPELARRPLPAHKETRVVVMKPGSTPLGALALVLARIATHDPSPVEKAEEFERVLRRKSDNGTYSGLKRIVNALLHVDMSPLVILIDQFEETYSLCKDVDERGAFVDNLIEVARASEARVSIVITLRTDFLGQTQRHPLLNQVIGSDKSVIVPAMTVEELRRAIAEPARQAGHPLENTLIDLLIEQTKGREGALPMLQFALTQIWEGLGQGKSASETLEEIGGVGGALANKAQEIYRELDNQQKDIARRVFIGLVQLGEGTSDTRRRVKVASLRAAQDDPQQVQQVLSRFSSPSTRLITLSGNEGQQVAEITHEALFDHWEQLNDWLDGCRDLIRQQRRIETTAEEWNKQGKSRGYLLQGRQLDDARQFSRRHARTFPLSPLAEELIRNSFRRRRSDALKVASVGIVLPLLLVEAFLHELEVTQDRGRLTSNNSGEQRVAAESLVKGCDAMMQAELWQFVFFYYVGERLLGNCRSLENQSLSDAQLQGAELRRANLYNADLRSANLRNANLIRAFLIAADLRDADLSGATLIETNLSNADLRGADLSANYSRADSSGVSLGASLRDADLGGADLSRAQNLTEDQVSKAILCKTKLPKSIKLNPDRDCTR